MLFHLERSGDLAPLRQALAAAGYTQEALADTTKVRDPTERADLAVVLRRTAAPSPYHTLVRLFLLGQSVTIETARTALTAVDVDQLIELGLLAHTSAGIRAVAQLSPVDDLLMVHDLGTEVIGGPLPPDYVLPVGPASHTLANLTVRRRGEKVLDLGTGSGIQALLAARHAAHVIGTDTNRRALNFAELNVRLNDMNNVELRAGSLYEPVVDERFDLIIANPPFVISPQSRYLFRDSGMPGDQVCEQVIRGAPRLLREDGYIVVLCNWHHRDEADWCERPRHWVAGNGCDAWILCFKTQEPLAYAANWLKPVEGRDPERYNELLDEWLRYYERIGIGLISSGAVILRRCSAAHNWIRTDRVPGGQRVGSCSDQIQRIFAAQTVLETIGDDRALFEQVLLLAPDHELEQELQAKDGGWSVKSSRLRQTGGFAFSGDMDPLTSVIAAACDGSHGLGAIVRHVAQSAGVEFSTIAAPAAAAVRKLMQWGFLTAVSATPNQDA